jgi:hypothetical protein
MRIDALHPVEPEKAAVSPTAAMVSAGVRHESRSKVSSASGG